MERARTLSLETEQVGTILLGAHVEDVDVSVPYARVEIGPGPEAVLVAPISIQCAELSVATSKVIVEGHSGQEADAVFLEADKYSGASVSSVPVIYGDVSLSASWPDVLSYPWTSFAVEPPQAHGPKTEEALRRFRKFVIEFRSHKNRGLARYRGKIEHSRMDKGVRAGGSRLHDEAADPSSGSIHVFS